MFGRKARQIANQSIMIATARAESHDHLSQIMEKNKKIIELGKALQEAHRQLEVERNELRQADQKVHRAESAADAAIQAAGIMGDQARAAQAALAEKETVIQELWQSNSEKSRNGVALGVDLDALKADKEKLSVALLGARATIAEKDITISELNAGKQKLAQALQQAHAYVNAIADADERKPGKPGTAQSRLPRLEIQQDVAQLLDEAIQTKTDTPALQALREEIAKVRHEEGVMPMPAQADAEPLPKRTPGRKLQEQAAEDAAEVAKETAP